MKVIDTHCHIGKSENTAGNEIPGDALVAGMDEHGITAAIVLPLPSVENHVAEHDSIARLQEKYSGRIFGAVCIRPQLGEEAVYQETKRCVEELGFVSIKFHPIHHACGPMSPRAEIIFNVAREFDIPVMCHTGAGAPWSLPSLLIPAAQKFRDVKFIAAHAGMEIYAEDAWVAAKQCDNVLLDSAWTSAGKTAWFVQTLGADKVMMSTDLPTNNATEMVKWKTIPITDEERAESLLHLPNRLFKLEEHGFRP